MSLVMYIMPPEATSAPITYSNTIASKILFVSTSLRLHSKIYFLLTISDTKIRVLCYYDVTGESYNYKTIEFRSLTHSSPSLMQLKIVHYIL
jgi:hypothetical protein